MDEKLILNDGTEIAGHYLEIDSRLFLYMFGITFTEAFEKLIIPENTESIRMIRYGQESQVTGYTRLYNVSDEMNGMICAGLRKQTNA